MNTIQKRIVAGNYIECDIIQCTEKQRQYWKSGTRGRKVRPSTIFQHRANEKHAQRHFIQLVNTNFRSGDKLVTVTYEGTAPDISSVKRDIKRLIDRLKALYIRLGVDFKYIYVIESGIVGGRLHIHLIIPKGILNEEIKRLCNAGACDIRRMYGSKNGGNGFTRLAKYLSKCRPIGAKRWIGSRNLVQPTISYIRETISKSIYNAILSALICNDCTSLAAIACRVFGKEYSFIRCETAENPVLQRPNIYFKLWRGQMPLIE